MNRSLAKKLMEVIPRSGLVGDVIYLMPINHVLSGFAFEKVRRHVRVYKFIMPLYDSFELLHLGYSKLILGVPNAASDVGGLVKVALDNYSEMDSLREGGAFSGYLHTEIDRLSADAFEEKEIGTLRHRLCLAQIYLLEGEEMKCRTELAELRKIIDRFFPGMLDMIDDGRGDEIQPLPSFLHWPTTSEIRSTVEFHNFRRTLDNSATEAKMSLLRREDANRAIWGLPPAMIDRSEA